MIPDQNSNQLLMMTYEALQLSALKQASANLNVTNYKVKTLKGNMVGIIHDVVNNQATITQTVNFPAIL